jgi:uncharacterized protein with von Willebrand factor type A (vWA) domain
MRAVRNKEVKGTFITTEGLIWSSYIKQGVIKMKYSLIVFAMVAALATGAFAKEGKGKGAAGAEPAKKEMTAEQKAEHTTKALERIKTKDEALYKELVALKEKDPAAFEKKMMEQHQKRHGEKGKGKKGGEKGKDCKDAAK